MGTRTGRANIEPNYHSVEAELSCDFTITTSATDRQVVYVYGEPRLWASFPGISWSTVNDNSNLKRKEFYSSNTLPSRLTMRITPPATAQPGDYNFWISIMKSPTTRCNDGMNLGDLFLVTVTVTPKQYKITLTSTGTMGEKNFGAIVLDGTTYTLYSYWGGNVMVTKCSGSYSVTMIPPSGYAFKGWNTSGQITVANTTSESTIISVFGDGLLEALIIPHLGNITGRVIDYETKSGVKSIVEYYCLEFLDFYELEGYLYGQVITDEYGNFLIINVPSCNYFIGAYEYERNMEYEYPTKYRYIPFWSDSSGKSWHEVTVIPNSSITVTLELIPFPRPVMDLETRTVSPGESLKVNVSIPSAFLSIITNATWENWELNTGIDVCCYYNMPILPDYMEPYPGLPLPEEMPDDLLINPWLINVDPYHIYYSTENSAPSELNFTAIFDVYVAPETSYGIYAIPIGLFLWYGEWYEIADLTWITVQVVPSNASIQTVGVAQQTFDIIIETNSTEVLNFAFNKSAKTISFEVSGPDSTIGYCNLTIPKTLMTPPFVISVNSQQIEFNITENSMFYFVYFTYSHSFKTLQITSQTLLGDSEPPTIISLTDVEELLTAEQNLTIYAFITDFDHEIDCVWLVYSVDGGVTWSEPIRMITQLGYIYIAQLAGLNQGDIIVYKIIAEDAAGNIAESEHYQVQVISEFPSIVFLRLFMCIILAVALYLKKKGVKF
jgi:hypothetical protein